MAQRLGRTVLLSNRFDWTAEQLITAYSGQRHIEQVFRGLKDGDWLGWGPMYRWTDQKIRVHAFYCMLGISLLQYLRRQAVDGNVPAPCHPIRPVSVQLPAQSMP
jgi:transposase